jgi:predicted  nucleic acid-binding Zn-ribbon protein|tara:strand:+ start:67 stop:501 length:435 start_codon:yes stop_codon:yes gene_type:complete
MIEVCPRCSGQISDSGSIFGFTGYTEICCIHCGWAKYTYEKEAESKPREFFDRKIVPYDEKLISQKRKDRPGGGYPDIEVFTDFKLYKSGFEKIMLSSRCPFCRKDKVLYKSKKTSSNNLRKSLCENKHVWYFKLENKEPVLWR